jgi:hypothetical protein
METKNLIIICVTIIALLLIAIGTLFMLSNNPIGTSLNVDIDSPVYINDTISIKLFDNESNPLANKTINLTLKNSKKEYVKTIKTNEKGIAKYKLNLPKGNYKLNASFSEEGYITSYATDSFELKKHEVKKATPKYTSQGDPLYAANGAKFVGYAGDGSWANYYKDGHYYDSDGVLIG